MSESTAVPFQYGAHQLRTILNPDGSVSVPVKDACAILGITNRKEALRRLDDDEKGHAVLETPGGRQTVVTITESGLYALVLRSAKPDAHTFRKWVTSEVLPAIRRTGRYELPADSITVPALLSLAAGEDAPRLVRAAAQELALSLNEGQAPPADDADMPDAETSIRAQSGVMLPESVWRRDGQWIEAACDDPPALSALAAHLIRRTAETGRRLELITVTPCVLRFRHTHR